MKRQYWALLTALLAFPAFGQIALRQSDAVEILVGPIFDAADLAEGTWTPETGLTIEDEHVLLTQCTAAGDCGAQAAKSETTSCPHVGVGVYKCDLNTDDTDTVGVLRVDIQMSATTPVWREFVIVEEAVYDASMAGSSAPLTAAAVVNEWETQSQADPTGFRVNVMEIGGQSQTANDNGADLNAVLADTNEMQGDWADGGRLDLILDARASQTSVNDVPTVAEFEARTLAAGSYFDFTTDSVRQASYTNADGDICVFVISEMEPHISVDCTEAP